jgi:hypothetical protein
MPTIAWFYGIAIQMFITIKALERVAGPDAE